MMFRAAIIAAITLVPSAALADTISLKAPMQAASLHEGDVDMVVYYLSRPDHFEVVATYVMAAEPDRPLRLRMGLAEGEATHFGLPGEKRVVYSFARHGDTVEVEARPAPIVAAQG